MTLTSIPREEPRYSSCEKKLIAVDWYMASAPTIAHAAYLAHALLSERINASGGTPRRAMKKTAYFMRHSKMLSLEYGDTMRPISWAVGSSLRTKTLYSDMSSPGTYTISLGFSWTFLHLPARIPSTSTL